MPPAGYDGKKAQSGTSGPRSNRDAMQAQTHDNGPFYTERETSVRIIPPSAHKVRQARPDRISEPSPNFDAVAHSSTSEPRSNRDAVEAQSSMSTPRSSLTTSETNSSRRNLVKLRASSATLQVNHLEDDPLTSPKSPNNMLEQDRNDELHNSRNELANNSRNKERTNLETLQVDNSDNNSVLDRSAELLNALSDDLLLSGEDIHRELVQQWTPILKKGLSDNVAEALQKKYATPGNCQLLKTPSLNEELNVEDHTRYRDQKLQKKQDQLGLGLTAIGRGITLLLDGAATGGERYEVNAMKHLRAGCYLLANLHFDQTKTRRILCSTDKYNVKKFLAEKLCKNTHNMSRPNFSAIDSQIDRDDTLFGQKVAKLVKKHYNATPEHPRPSSSSHCEPVRKSRSD